VCVVWWLLSRLSAWLSSLLYSHCPCLAHCSLRCIKAVCTDYVTWSGHIVACISQDIGSANLSAPFYFRKLKKHKISCSHLSGNLLTKVRENGSSFTKLIRRDRTENTQQMQVSCLFDKVDGLKFGLIFLLRTELKPTTLVFKQSKFTLERVAADIRCFKREIT